LVWETLVLPCLQNICLIVSVIDVITAIRKSIAGCIVSNSQYIASYESNYFITKHILAKFRSPYFCC